MSDASGTGNKGNEGGHGGGIGGVGMGGRLRDDRLGYGAKGRDAGDEDCGVCDNGSHEDGGVMQERGEEGGPTPLHHTSEAWPRTALSSFWGAFFYWGTMC